MNIVKLNRGSVELRNQYGILQKIITEKAQSADLSNCESLVVVTKLDGTVELRESNGILVKNIALNARDARFQGDDIVIYKNNGDVELRGKNGILIRNI
jgi:hypothetical protein